MTTNPLVDLQALGQSVWLDYIQRSMLTDGTLAQLIEDDGLTGITSNPAIFEQAIAHHPDYDHAIAELARTGATTAATYAALVLEDIRSAADLLKPIYDASAGRDGFVSIEVSPYLAYNAADTVAEAKQLWAQLKRPNVLIKVPGTKTGLVAIQQLIANGINVNVTLLFSLTRYREVLEAYTAGLEERVAANLPVDRVTSVASFFLSRIDVLVDAQLDALNNAEALTLRGEAAIALARLAYAHYRDVGSRSRWQTLAEKGARPQRLLWASTGSKDPRVSDIKYVEGLIGPETITTLPPPTLAAYRDHGHPAAHLQDDLDKARQLTAKLANLGIDIEAISKQLETEGVHKFIEPFDKLLDTLNRRLQHSTVGSH